MPDSVPGDSHWMSSGTTSRAVSRVAGGAGCSPWTRQWAEGERVADADLGIELTAQVVERYGASRQERAPRAYNEDDLIALSLR